MLLLLFHTQMTATNPVHGGPKEYFAQREVLMLQLPRENQRKLAKIRLVSNFKRSLGINWKHFGIDNEEGQKIDTQILHNFSKGWRKFGSVTSISNVQRRN